MEDRALADERMNFAEYLLNALLTISRRWLLTWQVKTGFLLTQFLSMSMKICHPLRNQSPTLTQLVTCYHGNCASSEEK